MQVSADGLRSKVITIDMIAKPILEITKAGVTVDASVFADPGQPWLPVSVQRQNGSGWTTVGHFQSVLWPVRRLGPLRSESTL